MNEIEQNQGSAESPTAADIGPNNVGFSQSLDQGAFPGDNDRLAPDAVASGGISVAGGTAGLSGNPVAADLG